MYVLRSNKLVMYEINYLICHNVWRDSNRNCSCILHVWILGLQLLEVRRWNTHLTFFKLYNTNNCGKLLTLCTANCASSAAV